MSDYEFIDPIKVVKRLEKKLDERTMDLMDFSFKAAEGVCLGLLAGAEITMAIAYFATKSVGWAIAGRFIWLVAFAAVRYAREREKGKDDAGMPLQ